MINAGLFKNENIARCVYVGQKVDFDIQCLLYTHGYSLEKKVLQYIHWLPTLCDEYIYDTILRGCTLQAKWHMPLHNRLEETCKYSIFYDGVLDPDILAQITRVYEIKP